MAQLYVSRKGQPVAEGVPLGPVRFTIGNSSGADLCIDDPALARRHVAVWLAAGQVQAELIAGRQARHNGAPVTGRLALRPGDRLVLDGDVVLGVDGPPPAEPEVGAGDDLAEAVAALPELVAAQREGGLLGLLVHRARALTGAPDGWAVSWEEDEEGGRVTIELLAREGDLSSIPAPDMISRSIVADAARSSRPRWYDDALIDDATAAARSVQDLVLRSVGCIPLGPSSALFLSDPRGPGRFDPVSRGKVEALCRVAAPLLARPGARRPAPAARLGELVGASPAMTGLFDKIRMFAPMPWPVLIMGESGTGKEGVARAVHMLSGRSGPLVVVDCGTIPQSLAESTLFGHVRGAFTGATTDRAGLIEEVDGGTLFLDEIGDLPAEVQVALLRLLQEGTWRAVGDTKTRTFAGRVLAATHRPIDDPLRRGPFREDLYHRLAGVVLRTPRLQERQEDIGLLAEHLLAQEQRRLPLEGGALSLAPGTAAALRGALEAQGWRGQVRGLQALLFSAIAQCVSAGRREIRPGDVAAGRTVAPVAATALPWDDVDDYEEATRRFQRAHVRRVLRESDGNKSEAARRLGVSRPGLFRMLARLEVDDGSDR